MGHPVSFRWATCRFDSSLYGLFAGYPTLALSAANSIIYRWL